MKYFQCELSQGTGRAMAYIEERAAKLGANVSVKDEGFDGLWAVTSVSDKGIDETVLKKMQQDSRNYIRNTDI